jgi:hypothetical protein
MKERKQVYCFYLSRQALDLARSVSKSTGVPMSIMCDEGLKAAARRRLEDHILAQQAREQQARK